MEERRRGGLAEGDEEGGYGEDAEMKKGMMMK